MLKWFIYIYVEWGLDFVKRNKKRKVMMSKKWKEENCSDKNERLFSDKIEKSDHSHSHPALIAMYAFYSFSFILFYQKKTFEFSLLSFTIGRISMRFHSTSCFFTLIACLEYWQYFLFKLKLKYLLWELKIILHFYYHHIVHRNLYLSSSLNQWKILDLKILAAAMYCCSYIADSSSSLYEL